MSFLGAETGVCVRVLACICVLFPSLSPDPSPSLDWRGMGGMGAIGAMGWFRRVYSQLRPGLERSSASTLLGSFLVCEVLDVRPESWTRAATIAC